MQFNFESSIRGYHVYKSIWTYEIGEKLRCDREENNPNDKSAVKLMEIKNNVQDMCPLNTAKYLIFFLKEVANYLQL